MPDRSDPLTEAAALESLYRRGTAAWPAVELPLASFRAFLSSRGLDLDAPLHEDLYLACGLALGLAEAREAFERAVLRDVPLAIRRVNADDEFVTDLTSELRIAWLEPAGPLSGYGGRGPLRSFVLVLATRRAIDRKRRPREIATDPDSLSKTGACDPRLEDIDGGQLRQAFLDALRDTLATLSARDRNVLRLHIIDGVSAETIGRMYGVHRATATRWIVHAKAAVLASTEQALRGRRPMSDDTWGSLATDDALAADADLSSFLKPQSGHRG